MSTARQLVDCKPPPPPTSVDTPAAVYADSATGTGNGSYPDDVREMHKYYWGDGRPTVGKDAPPLGDRLPPELRHDDYSSATGSGRLPSKLMSYGLPVCGDAGAAKLLSNAPPPPPGDYYQTSPGYVHAHGDCAAYGYGPSHDMASMMAPGGYHQQTAVGGGYTCQRMTSSSSPAQFGDVKAGMITPANTVELYQWVREQQNFACTAANAIGIYSSDNHCL